MKNLVLFLMLLVSVSSFSQEKLCKSNNTTTKCRINDEETSKFTVTKKVSFRPSKVRYSIRKGRFNKATITKKVKKAGFKKSFKMFKKETKKLQPTYSFDKVDVIPSFGKKATLTQFEKQLKKYIKKNIETNVQGDVWVSFVITEKGKIEVRKVTGSEELKDKASEIVNKIGTINPAMKDGKKVSSSFTTSITL